MTEKAKPESDLCSGCDSCTHTHLYFSTIHPEFICASSGTVFSCTLALSRWRSHRMVADQYDSTYLRKNLAEPGPFLYGFR